MNVARACRGFTLLEALVSIVLLAVLAAWMVPAVQRLGSAPLRLEAEAEARALLAGLDATAIRALAAGGGAGLPAQAGWSLAVEPFAAATAPLPPEHRWLLLRVVAAGADGTRVELARRVAAVALPRGQAAAGGGAP